MKVETETKTVYVSNDGKMKSYRKEDVANYETRQLKEIFEKRTQVRHIAVSTTLYLFKKGDIKSFHKFYPESYIGDIDDEIDDNEEGYFVYINDSSYDDVGDNYHLYHLDWYETLMNEKIKHYSDILEQITNSIMMREAVNFTRR